MRDINIIFDMDGTLIDTEKLYRKYWPMAFKDCGYELSDERALMLRSLGRPFAPELFKKWYGPEFDYNKVRNRRKEYIEDYVNKNGIELRPGVIDLLDFLDKEGITTAIATATDEERTSKYLKMVGLEGRFKKIICATMVEHGKPAPDIYNYASSCLSVEKENIFAVEDAPNGVKSAYSAGLKVIYVPDQTPVDDDIRDLIFAEVPRIDGIIDIVKKYREE